MTAAPSNEEIERAAELIRAGRLVVFPTETVYGLGANALDETAVERIFAAKGRPATSPLIVHVPSIDKAKNLVAQWPGEADRLARRFWPGPLTIVLPKKDVIPMRVTAGLSTVALRIPRHPVALALLEAARVPIAAPSANRFMALSPTAAAHVHVEADMVLDGGSAEVGIESTVISLVGQQAVELRPGAVTRAEIEALIGPVDLASEPHGAHPSPGMHERHYSPRTPLYIGMPRKGRGAYIFWNAGHAAAHAVHLPDDAREYAARLYETLHALDGEGYDWIAVEPVPDAAEWAAVRDRLNRAKSE